MILAPYSAIVGLAALAGALYLFGRRMGGAGVRAQTAIGIAALLIYAVNQWLLALPAVHTRVFPWTNYMYYSNWALPCAGLLAGSAMALTSSPFRALVRKSLVAVLLLLAYAASWRTAFPNYPYTNVNDFQGLVCRQSHDDSCGPAAIATYLRFLGRRATEWEVTQAAMTREGLGTSSLGLWRGLAAFRDEFPGDTRARVAQLSIDHIEDMSTPRVIRVQLRPDAPEEVYNRLKEFWPRGLSHAVVLLGRDASGMFLVADPAEGAIEAWREETLRALWDGSAYYLERLSQPLNAEIVLALAG